MDQTPSPTGDAAAGQTGPISVTGLLHISIPVEDMTESLRFYTEVLGLAVTGAHPNNPMAFLRAGDTHVILTKSKFGPREDFEYVHHAFTVADKAEYERAKEVCARHGIPVLHEEHRAEGYLTGWQFYVNDPYGNKIEIICFEGAGPGF